MCSSIIFCQLEHHPCFLSCTIVAHSWPLSGLVALCGFSFLWSRSDLIVTRNHISLTICKYLTRITYHVQALEFKYLLRSTRDWPMQTRAASATATWRCTAPLTYMYEDDGTTTHQCESFLLGWRRRATRPRSSWQSCPCLSTQLGLLFC
jgi:hypothetical protein